MKIITILLITSCCQPWNAFAQDREALQKDIRAMIAEKDPNKNVAAMPQIIKKHNLDTIRDAEDIDILQGVVVLSFLNVGAFSQFDVYIGQIKNKFNQTSYLNMGADQLVRDKKLLLQAEAIAKRTIDVYQSYRDDPSARPSTFPLADWNSFMERAAFPYYQTYADVLYLNGNYKMALLYQEKALTRFEPERLDQNTIAHYTILLQADGQYDKAYDILLKMARMGKSDADMNSQLKKLYLKKGRTEADATALLDSIHRHGKEIYQIETAKKMIADSVAPAFSLSDLSGKRISLKDLRGKVVVLDFWATWCVPCIASMPAMDMLRKQHPEVVFLFIATGEKEPAVRAYIQHQQLSFQVLMDTPSAQAGSVYAKKGIPTKVVIDKQGNLRFVTIGYTSASELIHEMEAMIAIVKAQ
jgi:thiol-disulfide isomerase/thioredoxin